MAKEKGEGHLISWECKKLHQKHKGLSPLYHFFDEKNFKETTDAWKDKCTIVGYSEGYELTGGTQITKIPKTALVVRHRDNALMGISYEKLL